VCVCVCVCPCPCLCVVWSCVVLFLLCICVCDLFFFLQVNRLSVCGRCSFGGLGCCSYRVCVCVSGVLFSVGVCCVTCFFLLLLGQPRRHRGVSPPDDALQIVHPHRRRRRAGREQGARRRRLAGTTSHLQDIVSLQSFTVRVNHPLFPPPPHLQSLPYTPYNIRDSNIVYRPRYKRRSWPADNTPANLHGRHGTTNTFTCILYIYGLPTCFPPLLYQVYRIIREHCDRSKLPAVSIAEILPKVIYIDYIYPSIHPSIYL